MGYVLILLIFALLAVLGLVSFTAGAGPAFLKPVQGPIAPVTNAVKPVAGVFGIIAVFFLKGLFDYAGNYFGSRVGLSVVTDLRQRVFEHVLAQDAEFFEINTTGRVMSSIMSDIEKIQTATSQLLADWLRQVFTATALLIDGSTPFPGLPPFTMFE